MSGPVQYTGSDPEEFTQWLQDFLPNAKLYVNAKMEQLLILQPYAEAKQKDGEKYLTHTIFTSQDGGRTYRQMHSNYSPSSQMHLHTYIDPLEENRYYLFFEGNIFTRFLHVGRNTDLGWKDHTFSHFSEVAYHPGLLNFSLYIPRPDVWVPKYFFSDGKGGYVYVDMPRYGSNLTDLRIFRGVPTEMKEIRISSRDRYYDGGTTVLVTDQGTLFIPSPSYPDWDDKAVWFGPGHKVRNLHIREVFPPGIEMLHALNFSERELFISNLVLIPLATTE